MKKTRLLVALMLIVGTVRVVVAEEDAHAKKIIEMIKDGKAGKYQGHDGILRDPVVSGTLTVEGSIEAEGVPISAGHASLTDDIAFAGPELIWTDNGPYGFATNAYQGTTVIPRGQVTVLTPGTTLSTNVLVTLPNTTALQADNSNLTLNLDKTWFLICNQTTNAVSFTGATFTPGLPKIDPKKSMIFMSGIFGITYYHTSQF
jgi:hypothetical protein